MDSGGILSKFRHSFYDIKNKRYYTQMDQNISQNSTNVENESVKDVQQIKKRYSTSVETKRLPKNVKNVLKNEKTNETISIPPIRDLDPLHEISAPDSKPFFYGNPFVEKHNGIMHLRKKEQEAEESVSSENAVSKPSTDCSMLVMIDVPAFFTCRELVNFVRPAAPEIALMKIVRDEVANKYMVAIKFKTTMAAAQFFEQYNNLEFNSIEPEKCSLHYVELIEAEDGVAIMGLVADPTYGETPTCSVCLEKMEENNVLVILCNHSFHAECIGQWADTTCPICRYTQTPELVPDQKCFDCGRTSDLWMCLICGNVGCGRYAEAHAHKHYETTSHIFTLQIGGKLVWDYAGDNYVHRLIENSTDGKPVEYDGTDGFEKEKEKISAVQLEYTCLLTSQLENQRLYYEEKLREADEKFNEHNRTTQQKINALESELKALRKDCASSKEELGNVTSAKKQLEKKCQLSQSKCQSLQRELEEEQQMCSLIRKDKDVLNLQKEELERLRRQEITALEEQLHDLMMHFETQVKIQEQVENGAVSKEELEESNLEVKEENKGTSKKSRRRVNKK